MPTIYCTKCGVRGNSKCPHCRSIFSDPTPRLSNGEKDFLRGAAQDYFEMFMGVKPDPESSAGKDGERRFFVSFWTYSKTEEEAIERVLGALHHYLPLTNLKVSACVHDWEIMPGETSSIGCGHEGNPEAVVPPDPFAPPEEVKTS